LSDHAKYYFYPYLKNIKFTHLVCITLEHDTVKIKIYPTPDKYNKWTAKIFDNDGEKIIVKDSLTEIYEYLNDKYSESPVIL
jgi:hypothetical protein